MTSEEIKARALERGASDEARWLRQIAYQLAKQTEQQAETNKLAGESNRLTRQMLADPQPVKRDAEAAPLGFYQTLFTELAKEGLTFSERYDVMTAVKEAIMRQRQQRTQPADPATEANSQPKGNPSDNLLQEFPMVNQTWGSPDQSINIEWAGAQQPKNDADSERGGHLFTEFKPDEKCQNHCGITFQQWLIKNAFNPGFARCPQRTQPAVPATETSSQPRCICLPGQRPLMTCPIHYGDWKPRS